MGWVRGNTPVEQARLARGRLAMRGMTDDAQVWAGLIQAFDLWRAVVAGYAQAYARVGVEQPVCGYRYAMLDADRQPRVATRAERSLWWSDASGLPPAAGVQMIDTLAEGDDPALPGLLCLHALRRANDDPLAETMRQSLTATRASTQPKVPVLVVHGTVDSLVLMAQTGQAYVAAARRQAVTAIGFWEVRRAQHFDAFVNLPAMAGKVQPLLPPAFEALDQMRAHLDGGPFPADRVID
ncbi:MAG: hypothetical protein IPK97_07030 [Ahniella sp.]|nr:hypothetical protein [Ahniella sp.]